ncbi:MAG TPA: glycine cleavage system protein GcvH [Acidobacteriota bacterium]|nr:glycine cleavage system protein GcvH [Acidobacteriota bacterium]
MIPRIAADILKKENTLQPTRTEAYCMYPADYLYSKDHIWISVHENIGTIGITDFAQHELGDVVYVDLPEAGDTFEANEPFGSLESVKAVSEVFCPVSGEISEINSRLGEDPELINSSPHEEAWLIKILIVNPEELKKLLNADEYQEYIQEQETM